MDGDQPRKTGWRGSADLWLDAAYQALIENGVDQVKLGPLAKGLGLSRTSFYGHFDSREALLDALIARWEAQNTGNLVARCEAYSATITEAIFNLFDCWIDPELFDAKFDFAIRTWALGDAALKSRLEEADQTRIAAITGMFTRHGYEEEVARVRAYTIYYTQIGDISMMVVEPVEQRIRRMPLYIETFTGTAPSEDEVARFASRHGFEAGDIMGSHP